MKIFMGIVLVCALAGCSTYQAHSNLPPLYARTNASQVQVLYSPLQRAYTSIGVVSANRYKPGWTDPTVSDAIPKLQAVGAQIGADGVIVRSDRSNNDRYVAVEGEAIKFASGANQ
jgi:hypothetical protein